MTVILGLLPEKWEDARKPVDEALRSLRDEVNIRWRLLQILVDTDTAPQGTIENSQVRGRPLAVLILAATVQRSPDGHSISSSAVEWECRGGRILLHSVEGLAATTRYNATVAVLEHING